MTLIVSSYRWLVNLRSLGWAFVKCNCVFAKSATLDIKTHTHRKHVPWELKQRAGGGLHAWDCQQTTSSQEGACSSLFCTALGRKACLISDLQNCETSIPVAWVVQFVATCHSSPSKVIHTFFLSPYSSHCFSSYLLIKAFPSQWLTRNILSNNPKGALMWRPPARPLFSFFFAFCNLWLCCLSGLHLWRGGQRGLLVWSPKLHLRIMLNLKKIYNKAFLFNAIVTTITDHWWR